MTRRDQLEVRVLDAFRAAYGSEPEMLAVAPGRVNLIGEHTDYNDGFVLPCAIDYETIIAARRSNGGQISILACDQNAETDQFDPAQPFVAQKQEWKNHVRGVLASFRQRSLPVSGMEIAVSGNVPQGAGLSSSASLSVALAKLCSEQLAPGTLSPTDLAQIAQQSENDFVGTACGIMDQLASARATSGNALQIDCRSLDVKAVAVPTDLGLLVIHSGITRGLVDSAYNERRAQCELAAQHYGVSALRDLTIDQLKANRAGLDDVSYRRARHVVTENARVLEASKALENGDIAKLSQLMAQSHASMRDDFEITLPAIDELVAMVAAVLEESGGVRMTGGGFGGCIVVLAKRDRLDDVHAVAERDYRAPDGTKAQIFACQPSSGAALLEL
ncbi:galactokinase [Parasphingorhabdus sp.]|uniref:galactokinase n=1 Tax=Parasphingorhabdus sp. TaxID=2709688 RepID=UPI003264C186